MQSFAVSLVFLLAQRRLWAKSRHLLLCRFSFQPRDVSGAKSEQNQKFRYLKKNFFQKLSKICVFLDFLLQRRLWAKGKPKNSRSCTFCSRHLSGPKGKTTRRWKIQHFLDRSFSFKPRDVSGRKKKTQQNFEICAVFTPEPSLALMENCKISRERVFAQTPLWAKRKTSWAIETAAFCCIVGFPFDPATSLGEIAWSLNPSYESQKMMYFFKKWTDIGTFCL